MSGPPPANLPDLTEEAALVGGTISLKHSFTPSPLRKRATGTPSKARCLLGPRFLGSSGEQLALYPRSPTSKPCGLE